MRANLRARKRRGMSNSYMTKDSFSPKEEKHQRQMS